MECLALVLDKKNNLQVVVPNTSPISLPRRLGRHQIFQRIARRTAHVYLTGIVHEEHLEHTEEIQRFYVETQHRQPSSWYTVHGKLLELRYDCCATPTPADATLPLTSRPRSLPPLFGPRSHRGSTTSSSSRQSPGPTSVRPVGPGPWGPLHFHRFILPWPRSLLGSSATRTSPKSNILFQRNEVGVGEGW